MTSFLKRDGREDGDTGIGRSNVTRETGVKVVQPGSQGPPGAPGAGRGKEGFFPESLEVVHCTDTLISDFWLPELRENRFLLF